MEVNIASYRTFQYLNLEMFNSVLFFQDIYLDFVLRDPSSVSVCVLTLPRRCHNLGKSTLGAWRCQTLTFHPIFHVSQFCSRQVASVCPPIFCLPNIYDKSILPMSIDSLIPHSSLKYSAANPTES